MRHPFKRDRLGKTWRGYIKVVKLRGDKSPDLLDMKRLRAFHIPSGCQFAANTWNHAWAKTETSELVGKIKAIAGHFKKEIKAAKRLCRP